MVNEENLTKGVTALMSFMVGSACLIIGGGVGSISEGDWEHTKARCAEQATARCPGQGRPSAECFRLTYLTCVGF